MGKILTCAKEIEAYLGMTVSTAIKEGFPIARFGRHLKANTDDLDAHVSVVANTQKEAVKSF